MMKKYILVIFALMLSVEVYANKQKEANFNACDQYYKVLEQVYNGGASVKLNFYSYSWELAHHFVSALRSSCNSEGKRLYGAVLFKPKYENGVCISADIAPSTDKYLQDGFCSEEEFIAQHVPHIIQSKHALKLENLCIPNLAVFSDMSVFALNLASFLDSDSDSEVVSFYYDSDSD